MSKPILGFTVAILVTFLFSWSGYGESGQSGKYKVAHNTIVSRTTETATWFPVTTTLPFQVEDDAPILVLPHEGRSRAVNAQKTGLDATILVSVQGGIYTSTDGGDRWMRTLTTSNRYKAKQFRVPGDGRSVYLDVQRDGENELHSWISRNRGMSWIKSTRQSGSAVRVSKINPAKPQKTDTLPFDITWSEPILLSDTGWSSYEPKIAVSGNDTVHVTWWNLYEGKNMSYCRSTDGGITFSPETEVFPGDTTGYRPSITVNESHVSLFFANGISNPIPNIDLHMLASTDAGLTWTSRTRIGVDSPAEVTQARQLKENIAVLFPPLDELPDYNAWRLLISTDGGVSWTKRPAQLNELSRIALSPTAIHMITNGGAYAHNETIEALYVRSTDLGQTWLDSTLLSVSDNWYSDVLTIDSFEPRPGFDQVWCAWRDTKYGWENFLGASLLGRFSLPGNKWIPERLYSPMDEPNASEPRLAANDSLRAISSLLDLGDQWHVGIAWTGYGITQFAPMLDLTPGLEVGDAPAVAVSHHSIHVVWDQRDLINPDRFHIWYRKGEVRVRRASAPLLNPGVTQLDSTPVYRSTTGAAFLQYNGIGDTLLVSSILSDNPNFTVTPEDGKITSDGGDSLALNLSFQATDARFDTGKVYLYHNGTSPSPSILTVFGSSYWRNGSVNFAPDTWHLISIPLEQVVPVSLPNLFEFSGKGYRQATSALPTRGYWVKPESSVYHFTGVWYSDTHGHEFDTIRVHKGWNLIGIATTDSVSIGAIAQLPVNNTASPFYGFDGLGYVSASVLEPGKAYFIKMNNDGVLVTPHQ